MYSEAELLPLSALQHLAFCARQCGLIHLEGIWLENRFTAEGRVLHERAHEQGGESRGKLRIARGLAIRSLELGLSGLADVVEFWREEPGAREIAHPVEYKRGKPKRDDSDRIQLCAQAMCLEEMLAIEVPQGALFYGRTKKRLTVEFDHALRKATSDAARRLHRLMANGRTPLPEYGEKCRSCSLALVCLPKKASGCGVDAYLEKQLLSILGEP